MTKLAADIAITYDGTDITDRVLYQKTQFQLQANPIAGSFKVAVKDPNQDFSPGFGKALTLHIDGVPMQGGYVKRIGRGHFFPVVDTSSPGQVKTRLWTLSGPDYNTLFDWRVIRDYDNITSALKVPKTKRTISRAIRHFVNHYIDKPAGLSMREVDVIDTHYGDDTHGGLYVQQAETWRAQMDDFRDNGGIVYYIDADFVLHAHEYETQRVSWLFTDYNPDGVKSIGFRDGEYEQDMLEMVTEALVWGGSSLARPGEDLETSEGIGIVFARYPSGAIADATWHGRLQSKEREQAAVDRQDQYGLWQKAEMNIGQENYLTKGSVKNRAFVMVAGPPGQVPTKGIEGGWNRPLERMTASWFAHDVPGGEHLRPGYLADFLLYTQGSDMAHPLITTLPLRSLTITFPTLPGAEQNPDGENKGYVRFDGQFGTSFSDNRHLWKALKRTRRRSRREIQTLVDDQLLEDAAPIPGSKATLTPLDDPDGSRQYFNFVATVWTDTADVYINGLLQRANLDYKWTTDNQLWFAVAPDADDDIYVIAQVSE